MLNRAQGCLLGQLAGDALGSMVEFMRPEEIRGSYPDGVRDLADGGTWDTLAGQPTDDGRLVVRVNGVGVFDSSTGEVCGDSADRIACWFIDTDYNGETLYGIPTSSARATRTRRSRPP